MGVPIFIFAAALALGAVVTAGWLPDCGPGRVGTLALVAVSGLVGITCALIAVHVYELTRQVHEVASLGMGSRADVVANDILTTLRDAGPVLGLAAAAFLLAPGPDDELVSSAGDDRV